MALSAAAALHPPAEVAGARVAAVAAAVEPEAGAAFVLDAKIVAHRVAFAGALPPFAKDALGPVAADEPVGAPAPGEAPWRQVGQLGHHMVDALGARQQPWRARPAVRPGGGIVERLEPAHAAF
ncbi:hypothetical protein VF09_06725, partial [Nostoc linckia z9]